jgi:hypothetical protein
MNFFDFNIVSRCFHLPYAGKVFSLFFFLLFAASICFAQTKEEVFPLETLLDSKGKIFNVSPDRFMKRMGNYFEWESKAKEKAKASSVSFLGFKALEAIACFKNGKFSKFEIYLYNRDDERCRKTYFWGLLDKALAKPDEWTGVAGERVPHEREGKFAILVKVWKKKPYLYTLRWACSHKDHKGFGERMRFEVSKLGAETEEPDKKKDIDKTQDAKKKSGKLSDNVIKKPSGDVFICNIKMVSDDYSENTVSKMVLKYYGLDYDLPKKVHETDNAVERRSGVYAAFKLIYKVAGTKIRVRLKELFFSDLLKVDELNAVDRRVWSRACKVISKYNRSARKAGVSKIKVAKYITRTDEKTYYYPKEMLAAMTPAGIRSMKLNKDKSEYRKFLKNVREYINSGIPVCWCMTPGILKKDAFLTPTADQDMKLIVGYNDKENKIIYLDSNGDQPLAKISYDDAWCATNAACVLIPRDRK